MKIKHYLYLAMTALVMTNCSQEEELQDIQQESFGTLTATIEGSSRSAVTDGGVFSWTSGDAISVWNGSQYVDYTWSSGDNFTGSANQISGYAIYPQGNHPSYSGNGLPQVNLSASYTYGSTNAIMLAKVQGNSNNLSFSHLGGLMRFTIKDIPSSATTFTFTANSGITGNFQVEPQNDGSNVIKATTSNSNQSVTISFDNSQLIDGTGTFYVPLPVGTYTGFTITVGNCSYTSQATNTIKRRTLLLMPTFTCDGTQLTKGGNAFTLENTEQDMNVSGDETLVIETPNSNDANAKLNLNYAPAEENATLNISDGQTGDSQDSKAKVVVDVENDNTVAELNIDAPTLTVELASGTYETITAKTAKQTLIIKSGVTVKNLKVIGGKVEIEKGADVKSQTQLRVLTFEDVDAKFEPYTLDYADVEITTWSDLIDDPQYGGPLTYADMMSAMYTWYDEGNTELSHIFPEVYGSYCYWSGGHAISNYWGAGYSNEDRNTHIAKYYGEDYVTENAGNDSMLGWFNLQLMTPIQPHSGENFAVHFGYSDFFSMSGETLPEIFFADGEARVIDHMYVTNTNYVLNQLMCGVGSEAGNTFGGSYTGPTENSWYKITAYGYASWDDEEPTSEAEFYLLDGTTPVLDWEKWNLSELGAVVRVKFNLSGSEDMSGSYGLTIPAYFAYDDVAVSFEN